MRVGDWVRVTMGDWYGSTGFVKRINNKDFTAEVEFIEDNESVWFQKYQLETFNPERETMETTQYTRKPFPVSAVQVTLQNIDQVAEWCHGSVELVNTRMLGTETPLPVIKIQGQGDNRGKTFTAALGCYVVEQKGSFRVYKPAQFDASFDTIPEKGLDVTDTPLQPLLWQERTEDIDDAEYISGVDELPSDVNA